MAHKPVVATETQAEAPSPAAEPEESPLTPDPAPTASAKAADDPSAPTAPATDELILALATPTTTFTVAKTTVTIGRGEENKIRLDDFSVSRRHARIAWKQGGYWLSDLGSMGGTWVDGARLNAPHRIAAGETIDIGVCRLTVSSAGAAGETEAKKSAGRPRSELADSRRRR
jgi:pSer/pThr/pTyr-binding forkhead associated (FHA) protein